MRILQLTPYCAPAYAFGGVVRAVEGLSRALALRGHSITILTTDALGHSNRYAGALDETDGDIRVIRCRNVSSWLRGRLNLSTPRGMKVAAEAILPDVDALHLHEFRTVENLLVTPIAKRLDVPVVLSPHGTLTHGTGRGRLKAGWDKLLGHSVMSRIDHVVALNETELADAGNLWAELGFASLPKSSVIPNGIDLREFESLPDPAGFRARYGLGDAPVVLYMGRLQARKGVDLLLRAFQAADAAGARLVIAGPDEGMLRALRDIAADDERIVFAGYLESDSRLEALAAADVFALAARGEGQPIAALEALAAGLPVILSPGCNMDEVVDAGAGIVAAATVEAFAGALGRLLHDESLRRRMGANACEMARERYGRASVAAAWEGVYKGLS